MPKKFEIKQPQKCQTCDKADDCEFLKLLLQKPFDASGVLLDCKSFYTVFCELEERCRIPHGDPEEMQHFEDDFLTGKRPFLIPAMVTNGVLAAELALKTLTLKETGAFDCIHDLDKLFYALPEDHKAELSAQIKEKSHENDATLKENLEAISNFFQDWRYFFERESISYNNFLPEFIHIVCDYAIADIDNEQSSSGGTDSCE